MLIDSWPTQRSGEHSFECAVYRMTGSGRLGSDQLATSETAGVRAGENTASGRYVKLASVCFFVLFSTGVLFSCTCFI